MFKELHEAKLIYKNSKKIKNQEELKRSLKFWRKKLDINNIFIDAKISSIKFLDSFRHPILSLLLSGGGYMRAIEPYKKYEIRIHPKQANEGALVHELSHIKLNHEEKKNIFFILEFEKEANLEVIKNKTLLGKRKKINPRSERLKRGFRIHEIKDFISKFNPFMIYF